MKFRLAIGCAALMWPSFALQAQETDQGPVSTEAEETVDAASENAIAASYRLLESTKYAEQIRASVYPMGLTFLNEGMEQEARRNGIELDEDLKAKMREAFVEELELVVEEFITDSRVEAGLIYSQYYTAAELDRLTEIYKDPVMIKSLQVGPKLQTELMTMGMQNMRKHQPAMEERMKQVVRDYLADNEEAEES